MKKLERDGKVAVVYSPDYGAGWSTWAYKGAEVLCMDADIAQAVLDGDQEKARRIGKEKVPDLYLGGQILEVKWVPKGTRFEIDEYDGYESVRVLSDVEWMTA